MASRSSASTARVVRLPSGGPGVDELAARGRMIVYDRRGCSRSERPEPYLTDVHEQADDAAALIGALGAAPAIVVGRGYGGETAIDLALRYPDRVRALVLLEASLLELGEAIGWAKRSVAAARTGKRWVAKRRELIPFTRNDVDKIAAELGPLLGAMVVFAAETGCARQRLRRSSGATSTARLVVHATRVHAGGPSEGAEDGAVTLL